MDDIAIQQIALLIDSLFHLVTSYLETLREAGIDTRELEKVFEERQRAFYDVQSFHSTGEHQ